MKPSPRKPKRHEEAGDDLGHRIYALLYVIASFHPNYEVKGKIEDPEYRARVADVLWVKREGAAGGREYKVESWRNRK